MKYDEIDEGFKKVFQDFLEVVLGSKRLSREVEGLENYDELKSFFSEYSDSIRDASGGECDECSEKDTSIEELKGERDGFSDEVDELTEVLGRSLTSSTIDEDYKIESLKRLFNELSVSKIEEIVKNNL